MEIVNKSMSALPDLVPCHLCGSTIVRVNYENYPNGKHILCWECGLKTMNYNSKKAAYDAWNKRVGKFYTHHGKEVLLEPDWDKLAYGKKHRKTK